MTDVEKTVVIAEMSCATLSPSATTALAIISVIARSVGTAIIKVMCLMEILYLLPRAEEPRCVSSNSLTIAGVRERRMGSLHHFLTKGSRLLRGGGYSLYRREGSFSETHRPRA